MKKNYFRIFYVSVLCLLTTTLVFSQNDSTLSSAAGDLYVISAKAGGVNYVEGKTAITRVNGKSGYLVKGDNLEVGDKVSTDANSRIEVLLNPGSFVRLDQNSEFEFITTSLDDLKLQVTRGSALLEVFASDDFKVTVTTPKARFYLITTGVYRIDVLSDGVGRLEVYRGKASTGNSSAEIIKKGRAATVSGNDVAVAKFDRDEMDSFESWSKSRAKLTARANKKLATDRLRNSLLSGRRINCFDSLGLWVLNPRYRSYSFLPFGQGWRSPYGFGFGTSTGICDYPFFNSYRPRYRGNRYPRRGTTGGTTRTNNPPARNVERGTRVRTPPFRRMERTRNVSVRRTRSTIFPTPRTRTTRTNTTTTTTPRRTQPARTVVTPRKSKGKN
jgi:hypothetical protein